MLKWGNIGEVGQDEGTSPIGHLEVAESIWPVWGCGVMDPGEKSRGFPFGPLFLPPRVPFSHPTPVLSQLIGLTVHYQEQKKEARM